jgi:hypothetical protein
MRKEAIIYYNSQRVTLWANTENSEEFNLVWNLVHTEYNIFLYSLGLPEATLRAYIIGLVWMISPLDSLTIMYKEDVLSLN